MSTFAVLKIETISKCILYLVRIDFNFNQHRGNRFGRERRFNCSTCAQLKKQTVNCCTRYQAWTIAPHAVPPFIIFHGSRYRASSFTIRPVCFAFSRHFARNLRRGALRGRKKKEREREEQKKRRFFLFFSRDETILLFERLRVCVFSMIYKGKFDSPIYHKSIRNIYSIFSLHCLIERILFQIP